MAFALRPEDLYHTGIVVPDLDAAMARLSALAGYRWITPLSYTLPFRTATGTHELTSTIVYSLQSPHVELVQEVPGTPWTAAPGNSVHHLGYFTDNLAETARMLEDNGFTFEMTAAVSGSGSGAVRLLRRRCWHPHRDRRPRAVSRLSRVPAVSGGPPRLTVSDMLLTVLRFNFGSPQGEPTHAEQAVLCRARTGTVGRVPRHHLGECR